MRFACTAVVPEKVRVLSRLSDVLMVRPVEAAPALAGLCFGFMPAANPEAESGGRSFPITVELDAPDMARLCSEPVFDALILLAPSGDFLP